MLFVSVSPEPASLWGVIAISWDSSSHRMSNVVVPDGPKLFGLMSSTPISTAVAFAVAHVTVTGAVTAKPQLTSVKSNVVTSAAPGSELPESFDPPHPAAARAQQSATPATARSIDAILNPLGCHTNDPRFC